MNDVRADEHRLADPTSTPQESADQHWFREPCERERRIAAWLFMGFSFGFVMLFFVLRGWWFRYVILGLGVYSFLYGYRHARDLRRARGRSR
jgi:hypothetical protein